MEWVYYDNISDSILRALKTTKNMTVNICGHKINGFIYKTFCGYFFYVNNGENSNTDLIKYIKNKKGCNSLEEYISKEYHIKARQGTFPYMNTREEVLSILRLLSNIKNNQEQKIKIKIL